MTNDFRKDLILEFLKEHNMSKTKFCKECKIGYQTLTKLLNNDLTVGVKSLFRICYFMKIPPHKFFEP